MVSMSEFLSGFSHAGQSVIQEGSIDPSARREGLEELGSFGLNTQGDGELGARPVRDSQHYNLYGDVIGDAKYKEDMEDWMQAKDYMDNATEYGMQPNGNLRLDPSDFKFGGPEMFARLMQSGEMDGGYLSDASQNAQFAGATSGLMDQAGAASRDRLRNASASNMNSIFAGRQEGLANTSVMGKIMGLRAGLKDQLAERQFKAQEGFVNMMAQNDVAEKQFKVNAQTSLAGAQMGAMGAIDGAKISASATKSGAMMGMVGGIIDRKSVV